MKGCVCTKNFFCSQAREREDPVIPACGYVKHGKGIVTKHDLAISGRKNAERIMNLPPGINTGDGGGFDMHLSNKVCFCLFGSTVGTRLILLLVKQKGKLPLLLFKKMTVNGRVVN